MSRIVVGVDSSEGSDSALTWALDEAALRSADLETVFAVTPPVVAPFVTPMSGIAIDSEWEARANEYLDREITKALAGRQLEIKIERKVLIGDPSTLLVGASKGADLVVVGARGHGAFFGALLGSVSDRVVHHAHCPVVIVRHSGH